MNRETMEKSLRDLNRLVLEGRPLEAFEKYYHDDVVMQENDLPPTVSKRLNRDRETKFYSDVTEFREARVDGIGFGADMSYVIWTYDYTHRDWGIRHYTQVSVQQWQDDRIIHERFIYDN